MNKPSQQQVFEALSNAEANGYEGFAEWSAEDIALDLIAYEYDCEGVTVDDLLPHVRAWLAVRP